MSSSSYVQFSGRQGSISSLTASTPAYRLMDLEIRLGEAESNFPPRSARSGLIVYGTPTVYSIPTTACTAVANAIVFLSTLIAEDWESDRADGQIVEEVPDNQDRGLSPDDTWPTRVVGMAGLSALASLLSWVRKRKRRLESKGKVLGEVICDKKFAFECWTPISTSLFRAFQYA